MEGVKEDKEGIEDEEALTKENAWRRRRSRSVRDATYFFGGVVYQSKEKTGMERVKTGKMISHRI